MSTEPRTAVVNVLVTRPLEIPEPDWCAGHPEQRAEFKADVTHFGPEHVLGGDTPLFRAMLGQSPYAELASRDFGLYVEQEGITGSYTPDEVEQLAADLVQAAEQLRALGRQLADLLDGGTT